MGDAYDRLHDLERKKRNLENDCRAVLRLRLMRFSLRLGDDRGALMWRIIGVFAFHGEGNCFLRLNGDPNGTSPFTERRAVRIACRFRRSSAQPNPASEATIRPRSWVQPLMGSGNAVCFAPAEQKRTR